ncbi:unnamed protein product, partial [Ascophyllum nodosum]
QNPTVTTFGLISEGSLPHLGIAKSAIYVHYALARRSTPTAMVARSRSKKSKHHGVCDWLPDTFLAQLWFNRHPEVTSHGFGLDHLTIRDSRSLLATIPLMVGQLHSYADSIIVDGTSFTSLAYDVNSHYQENTGISFHNAAAANGDDLYIGRLEFALVPKNDRGGDYNDQHFDIASISAAPWPPQYVLDTVAGEDGLVLVNNVNCGYVDLATNLLRSIQRVSDAKVLWVAMDDVAFDFMDAIAPGCTVMFPFNGTVVPHATKAGAFGDDVFKAEVLVRPHILQAILKRGYPLLWTDSDMVWLRNPLTVLPKVNDTNGADLMLMIGGQPEHLCTCLLFMKPVPAAKELLVLWEKEIIKIHAKQDQATFVHPVVLELFQGMKMDIFSNESFPPGRRYFDHPFQENDPAHDNVFVVHNNNIKGHDEKVKRFKEYNLWDLGNASIPQCGERL